MFNEVKKTVKITDIVAKYGYQMNNSKKIHCPFHEGDNTASCSINAEKNSFKCFACNAGGSVIDFVALHDNIEPKQAVEKLCREYGISTENNHNGNQSKTKGQGKKDREHVYTDENGNILAKKTMYKYPDGSKSGLWNRYDNSTQQYIKKCGLDGLKMPLYHVGRLKNADIVYIVEGEKDVETLEKIGYTATSKPNGAGQKWEKDFNRYLQDKKCIILTDNDDSGEKAGIKTAESLVKDGITCKLIRATDIYKDVKPKGDITDIVEEVGTEKALDLLQNAVNNTADYIPTSTETEQERKQNNELLEMLLNANLTDDKIKTIKRILIDQNPYNADGTGRLNPCNLAEYLSDKGITVRYDDIKHDLKITGYNGEKTYSKSLFLNDCRYELEKYLKYCTSERLASSITTIAMKQHFNPVLDLIDSVERDGKDHLKTAYEVLGIQDTEKYYISQEILKTWLKQAYCMLHNGFCGETFGADYVLVLQGKQGKGKTSFFRKLAVNRDYFGEGMTLNVDDKDSVIKVLTKFIAELGEMESTFKKDKDKIKAFVTNEVDNYRLPYGETYMEYPRLTSLCGTVNSVEFLIDDTGNRRYGVIPIAENHDIMKHLDRLDPLQLWAEIRDMVRNDLKNGKTYSNCFRDRDLQKAINAINIRFQKPLVAELEIKEILEEQSAPTTDNYHKNETVCMSASQFKEVHYNKLSKFSLVQIKAVFERLGIPKEEQVKRSYNGTPLKNTYKVPYIRYIGK